MASQVPIPKSSDAPPAVAPAWNGGATLRDEHERLARASEIGTQQQGYVDESGKSKLFRKLKQEPAVPIGSLLTVGALLYASHYLRTGDRVNFQKALRWRVGLQGATIVAAIAGTLYYGSGDPAAPSSSSADIATAPGRPATVHQVQRAEERKESQRAILAERMKEAEEKERLREEEEAKHVDNLLRPAGGKRSWPVVGQDKRTF